ncbi:uncharacterized protein LOC143358230 [Halictus rubicundus]|uniref:uncharacterized protein LOC143358230 n=1 Tax=Halictus rubicundus TaxID=77578 RepID=UPI0040361C16
MEGLEGKVEKVEMEGREKGAEGEEDRMGKGEVEEYRRRIRRIEVKQDRKEREERRNNVVIRGIQTEGEGIEMEVKRVWEVMGMKYEGIKEIKKIGGMGKDGRGLVLVKLADREQKRKVMRERSKLRGKKERLDDDLTEEERRARWKIEREAEKERRKGRNVQVGYMKMWVNGKLRPWDEIEESWVDEQGNGQGR